LRRHERLLRGLAIELGRHRQHGKGLRRLVELRPCGLVHQRYPEIAIVVVIKAERASGRILLQHRDPIRRDVAGLGIEAAERGIAEIGEIDAAVGIAHHVVGLIGLLRQLVGGDDGAGTAPRQALERLQRVGKGLPIAEVDRGQIGGEPLQAVRLLHQKAGGLAGAHLRRQRRRILGVAQHARDGQHPLIDRVAGPRDTLQGVTAHAIGDEPLLRIGARPARQPFGAGQLGGEIARLRELEIGHRGRRSGHRRRHLTVEVVADGADRNRIGAGHQAARREAVAAVVVGGHGDGNTGRRPDRRCRHGDSRHRALRGGSNGAGEGGAAVGAGCSVERGEG
jgi:hypothetical protein